jgi:ribonucleoside-diphosphate reductase beta chain
MTPAERHMIQRLVAFFATGDSIVSNNLVLNLYKHINSPEARLYLSRQLFEEAVHVEFYLTLLDTYIPDPNERAVAFRAVENIPSVKKKADFCHKYLFATAKIDRLVTREDRRAFLMDLLCFATCVEGLFFFGAFAYVYFLRSKGMLKGLADGTDWVFRDESMHMQFALKIVEIARTEEPDLFDDAMNARVIEMIKEAVECEMQFAQDVLSLGVAGISAQNMREYLQFLADQRFLVLGIKPQFHSRNPFGFMSMQGVQGLGNLFERTVSEYQKGAQGTVRFDAKF